jgi:hypothetical protein
MNINMKRIAILITLGCLLAVLSGCCTTEERIANVGESIHNIALDGDGVN